MSKSLGNTIAPSDVEKQFGAEILRLWVTSVDSSNDVRIFMDILSQVSETYRKIRNTLRFLIANTSDFNPAEDAVAYEELRSVDKYMTIRFNQLVDTIRKAYADFEFLTIYKAIVNFVTVDLSAFYLDFAKDDFLLPVHVPHDGIQAAGGEDPVPLWLMIRAVFQV